MNRVNKEKTARAQLISKMWQTVKYQPGTTNCGNCEHSDKEEWVEEKGWCNLVSTVPTPINRHGICRRHSAFEKE